MAQVFLNLSTSLNRVLNSDKATQLRQLTLVQDESYTFNLAFQNGATPFVPNITSFAFYVRTVGGTTSLVSASSVTNVGGAFPYTFALTLTSPTLAALLSSGEFANVIGYITWVDGSDIFILEPFNIRVFASTEGALNYVASINGLDGTVGITGNGLTVSSSGNNVVIDSAKPYQSYATPIGTETKVLNAASPLLWIIDATNTNATFHLPDATTVDGRDYTLKKVDASGNTVSAIPFGTQTIEGRQGVYVADQWEFIHVLAAGGNWIVLDAINLVDP